MHCGSACSFSKGRNNRAKGLPHRPPNTTMKAIAEQFSAMMVTGRQLTISEAFTSFSQLPDCHGSRSLVNGNPRAIYQNPVRHFLVRKGTNQIVASCYTPLNCFQ